MCDGVMRLAFSPSFKTLPGKGLIDLGLYAEALAECQMMAMGVFAEVGDALGYFPNVSRVKNVRFITMLTLLQIYNLKQECLMPPLCYNFTLVEDYLAV